MPADALLLPFGFHLPTQQLIAIEAIDEARRGAACDCVCPGCRAPLLAKFPRSTSGPTRHFAHAPGAQCVAPETVLHKTAKLIVAQERRLWLPARPGKPAHRQEFDAGVAEHPFGPPPPNDFAADAMLTLQGRQLLVEIVVTHDLDERKHRFVIENRLHMVRVDLSTFPREFSLPGLRQRLIAPYPGLDRWIYPVPPPLTPEAPPASSYPAASPGSSAILPRQIILGMTMQLRVVLRRINRHRGLEPHVPECPLMPRSWKRFYWANAFLDCSTCPGRNPDFRHMHPYKHVFCRALRYGDPFPVRPAAPR